MLLRWIIADQQSRRRIEDFPHTGGGFWLASKCRGKGREVGSTVMVDIVSLQHHASKFLQQVVLFVRGAVRAENPNRLSTILVANLGESFSNQSKRLFPCGRSQPAVLANQRLRQPIFVMRKIESIAPLDAKKIAVDAALVAIVPTHNLHAGIGSADTQCRLAAVGAMSARRAHVLHLPWTRLVAIRARSQRPHRAYIDAHAALFALQMVIVIGRNDRADATVLYAQCPNIHALAAHPHTAVAKNAARPVKEDHRRPLLLFLVILG